MATYPVIATQTVNVDNNSALRVSATYDSTNDKVWVSQNGSIASVQTLNLIRYPSASGTTIAEVTFDLITTAGITVVNAITSSNSKVVLFVDKFDGNIWLETTSVNGLELKVGSKSVRLIKVSSTDGSLLTSFSDAELGISFPTTLNGNLIKAISQFNDGTLLLSVTANHGVSIAKEMLYRVHPTTGAGTLLFNSKGVENLNPVFTSPDDRALYFSNDSFIELRELDGTFVENSSPNNTLGGMFSTIYKSIFSASTGNTVAMQQFGSNATTMILNYVETDFKPYINGSGLNYDYLSFPITYVLLGDNYPVNGLNIPIQYDMNYKKKVTYPSRGQQEPIFTPLPIT